MESKLLPLSSVSKSPLTYSKTGKPSKNPPPEIEISKAPHTKDITQDSPLIENYVDLRKVKNKNHPLYQFDDIGSHIHAIKDILKTLKSTFDQYYMGKFSLKEVTQTFEESFENLKAFNVEKGRTSGSNIEDNRRLLIDTYDIFRREGVVWAAGRASNIKGEAIASKYGPTRNSDGTYKQLDWVYYDADIHYKSEDARSALKDMVGQLASKYYLGPIETSPYDNDDGIDRTNASYNEYWAFLSANSINRCKFIDPSLAPPRGFTLFFKEQKYSDETLKNSKPYLLTATDGFNKFTRKITVPIGESFWKNGRLFDLSPFKINNALLNVEDQYYLPDNPYTDIINLNLLSPFFSQPIQTAEDFDIFIETHIFNPNAGVLIIGDGNQSEEIEVPFNIFSASGRGKQHFNAAECFSKNAKSDGRLAYSPQSLAFLKNFNLFTRTYGFIHQVRY